MNPTATDHGVSSVVGIMLLLTVLVILAGVFAVTATGIFAPANAPIDAELSYLCTTESGTPSKTTYVFEMTAGDPFQKANLKLVLRDSTNATCYEQILGTDIRSPHDSAVMLADLLQVTQPKSLADKPYVTWMFFDTASGTLLSSGEIRS